MTFNEKLDIEIHEMNSNFIEMRIPNKKDYMNELGVVHGGIIMSLADVATGLLAIDLKYTAPTQSSYTNFLNAIRKTEYIYAKAEIIKRGKRTVTIDCKIWSDDTKLAAVNRSEYIILNEDTETLNTGFINNLKTGTYKKY